jgi:signal transduction histidine kinase/Tfp pilus assembly protein PilF
MIAESLSLSLYSTVMRSYLSLYRLFFKVLSYSFLLLITIQEVKGQYKPDTAAINKDIRIATQLARNNLTDSAMSMLRKTITQSRAINYRQGIAKANSLSGDVHRESSNYPRAQEYYEEALRYCDTLGASRDITGSVYNNLAATHYFLGDYEVSIRYFQRAVPFLPEERQASAYSNMGSIFNNMNEPDKALYYLDKATSLAAKYKAYRAQADIWNNKAASYGIKKDWPRTEACFKEALILSEKHGYNDCRQFTYANMGVYALERSNIRKAIRYLLIAESITDGVAPNYRNQVQVNLGRAYLELKQYDSALYYLKNALITAEKLRVPENLNQIHNYLARTYAAQGDYALAYRHQGIQKTFADSLSNKEKMEVVMRIEARYRTTQKDKEIAENQLTINRQRTDIYTRNIGIGVTISGLLVAGIVILLLRRNYKHKQALKDERMQHLVRQQELSEMKAVMNGEEKERTRIARELHDGIMVHFSATRMHLNALMDNRQRLVMPPDLEPILEEMNKVSDDLRRTAHNLMPDMLLEEGLAEAVYYFCTSLSKGLPLNIQYEQLSDIPRFELQFELSVYRIIQELLQNIIKHAKAGEAYVQLNYDNNLLSIVIEDDGIGMEASVQQGHKGLGLKSIDARVLSLNGRMEIASNTKGTSVNLEFDMNHEL